MTAMDLSKKRIVVTGGAGFLGSFVVEALTARGCQNVFVPRSREYDLVDMSAVRRLLDDARPDVIVIQPRTKEFGAYLVEVGFEPTDRKLGAFRIWVAQKAK